MPYILDVFESWEFYNVYGFSTPFLIELSILIMGICGTHKNPKPFMIRQQNIKEN